MSKHAWASRWQLQQNSMTRCSDMWSLVSLQCRVVTAPEEKWWAAFWKCQVWRFKLACADKCLTHTEQKGCLGTLDRTFVVKMTMSWAAHVSRIYSLFNKYRYVLNTYYVPGTTSQDGGSKEKKTQSHLWGVQNLENKSRKFHHVV